MASAERKPIMKVWGRAWTKGARRPEAPPRNSSTELRTQLNGRRKTYTFAILSSDELLCFFRKVKTQQPFRL